MSAHRFAFALAGLGFGHFALASPISPISQDRVIEASTEIASDEGDESDFDSDFATDFGLFNSLVDAQSQMGPLDTTVSASADQTSEILGESIYGLGSGGTAGDESDDFSQAGYGSSLMNITFELGEAVPFELTGSLLAGSFGDAESIAAFSLTGDDGAIIDLTLFDGSEPLNLSGTLPAGVYTLIASASASLFSAGASATASFDFDFVIVPEPATALVVGLAALFFRRLHRRPKTRLQ